MSLSAELYKSLRRNIESESEARTEVRKRAVEEDERRKLRVALEALNEAWPKMGGSIEDVLPPAVEDEVLPVNEGSAGESPQEPALNGSYKHITVVAPPGGAKKDIIQRYVADMLAIPEMDTITQTKIKDRILQEYPGFNVNSLRVAIAARLNELAEEGVLELVEKARAGSPNVYRKKGTRAKEAEEFTLGP